MANKHSKPQKFRPRRSEFSHLTDGESSQTVLAGQRLETSTEDEKIMCIIFESKESEEEN